MKKYLLLLMLFILFFSSVNAMFFEKAGVRNAAMGDVGIASTLDASASIWNPALLGELQSIEIATDHRKYFWGLDNDDLLFNYAAISFPLGYLGTFALSANQFDSNIYQERRVGLHYGRNFFNNVFAIGFSGNYYNVNYGENEFTVNDPFFIENGDSTDDFDFDLGLSYRVSNRIKIGLAVSNILEADLALDSENQELLAQVIGGGVQYQWNTNLLAAVDVDLISSNSLADNEILIKAGLEYVVHDILKLRCGLNTRKATAGFGLNIVDKEYINKYYSPLSSEEYINIKSLKLSLDYSFQYGFSELEASFGDHYIGLKIDFSSSTDKVTKLSEYVPPKTEYVTQVEVDDLGLEDVTIDSVNIAERVIIDTVFIENTIWDTVIAFSGVPDSVYLKKVKELNALKVKYEQVRNNNRAQVHLLNSLEEFFAGNYDVAIEECNSAIAIAPDITLSYIRLGSIYYKIGELEKAKINWKKAERMDPNNPEVKKIKEYLNRIE